MKKVMIKYLLLAFFTLYFVNSNGQSSFASFTGFGWVDIGWTIVTPNEYTIVGSADFIMDNFNGKPLKTVKINCMNAALSSGQDLTLMSFSGFILSQNTVFNNLKVANCIATWAVGYQVQRTFSAGVSLSGTSVGSSGFSYGANFETYYEYSASDLGSQKFYYYYEI